MLHHLIKTRMTCGIGWLRNFLRAHGSWEVISRGCRTIEEEDRGVGEIVQLDPNGESFLSRHLPSSESW